MPAATLFVTGFITLHAAHLAADYILQTDTMALHKAGWIDDTGRHHHGWEANQAHAGVHTLLSLAMIYTVLDWALGLHPGAGGVIAALAWIHISHSFIDRRWPITWWMKTTGSGGFLDRGGAPLVDQAAHVTLGVLPAALLLAKLS